MVVEKLLEVSVFKFQLPISHDQLRYSQNLYYFTQFPRQVYKNRIILDKTHHCRAKCDPHE